MHILATVEDFPAVGKAVVEALTALQGIDTRVRSEEEPGRILHEHRESEEYRNPRWAYPYYGSVDATPWYVLLVQQLARCHGPGILGLVVRDTRGRPVSVLQGVERAVAWIERRVERLGFLYVLRAQPHGLRNQVWPDSYDAFYTEDGRLFDPDVAYSPVTVQGYAYDALLAGADLTADKALSKRWRACAAKLRRDVLRAFWSREMGTFALALVHGQGEPRPALVVASDAGHLLNGRLLEGDDAAAKREALCRRLLAPDMLAGAGVRTKSVGAPRFNPGGYHNGAVWPMDTGRIADGLRRHGYAGEAADLEERILRACAQLGRMAEFFRGDTDGRVRVNERTYELEMEGERRKVEQPPQPLQGWTTSRVFRIMRRRGLISL